MRVLPTIFYLIERAHSFPRNKEGGEIGKGKKKRGKRIDNNLLPLRRNLRVKCPCVVVDGPRRLGDEFLVEGCALEKCLPGLGV
jgi:hypothetical protein